jgi:hypothetical protein
MPGPKGSPTFGRVDAAEIVHGLYIGANGATGTATVAEYVPPADEYIVVKWRVSGEFTVLKKRQ